jgi:hypothetical protein
MKWSKRHKALGGLCPEECAEGFLKEPITRSGRLFTLRNQYDEGMFLIQVVDANSLHYLQLKEKLDRILEAIDR